MSELILDLQIALSEPLPWYPTEAQLHGWLAATLEQFERESRSEVTLRLVDEAEMVALNRDYRGKNSTTNILSFPYEGPHYEAATLLGDLIIDPVVVNREAVEQGKSREAHWAHITLHGLLHLLGYDHQQESEAEEMEQLEVELLQQFGYADPYQEIQPFD